MAVLAAVAVLALPIAPAPDSPAEVSWPVPVFQPAQVVQGCDVRCWHHRFVAQGHKLRAQRQRALSLRRTLLHRGSVTEALNLACVVYGSCSTLWRRARCESKLDETAHNPSGASGLLQFLPSTFASTPFGRMSIYSPYASALAAGWMITVAHRGNEWSCR